MPSKPSRTKPKNKTNPEPGRLSYQFEAIGTVWEIEVFEAVSSSQAKAIQKAVANLIGGFDKNYSRFRPDSLVSRMSQRAGDYTLPADAQPMLELYRRLYDLTAGAMTPLIGKTMEQAGYDAGYNFKIGALSAPPAWDDTMDYQPPTLHLKQPVLLDFGAAGKGQLVDLVGGLLDRLGFKSFCVNAGGDILYHSASAQTLQVGLEHPTNPSQAIGIANIHNQSLCGSAGNRRAWGKNQEFHHIMDPRALASPKHIRALWTTAGDCLLADALSTALFFTPASQLQKVYTFEHAIVYDDYSLEHSAGFPASFFTDRANITSEA